MIKRTSVQRFTCAACGVVFIAREPDRDLCQCELAPQGHPLGWSLVEYQCQDCGHTHYCWHCAACEEASA